MTSSRYQQSATTSNTNAYRATPQSGPLYYRWVATYTSGVSAGLYLFASTGTGTERGNSYRIWQDATHVRIYKSVNNAATLRASFAAPNVAGQTHSYQVIYDPLTGKLQAWCDNAFLGSWTDTTPLTSGSYLSLRTDSADVRFDDLVVSEVTKYYESRGQRVAMRKNGAVSYVFGDHLGSTSVTANASGTRTGELWYKPWGESRGTSYGTMPTTYHFTGQREDESVGLYYYGARYYDSVLGRFIQADSIVPSPGNPQSLNRYSYVRNNPLRYVDSNGHCGPLTPVCLALLLGGMALLLQGDSPDLNVTPDDVASQRLGGALFVGGATLAGGSALAGAGGAARAGTTAATAACADGDCTNEVHGAGQVVQSATQAMQSVWKLDPLKRGQVVERLLGRSPQLTQNFPVIDRFENGVATSIKSIDLGAKSYQNVGTLISTVKGYINDLAGWQGVRWGGVEIRPSQIAARELVLAISQGATQAQLAALQQLQKWASTVGVTVNVTVIP